MRNHDQKTRDMARSILPSTARHVSRKRKQDSARRARARNNARLRRLMEYLDDLDAFEEPLDGYDLDDDHSCKFGCCATGMVQSRRAADKIAPLVRWAEARIARTPHLIEGDYSTRRNYFAVILGDSLVGRHALSHLDHLFGVENPWSYGRTPGELTWEQERELRRSKKRAEGAARARLLDEVLTGADARRLNARITALTPPIEQNWALDSERRRVRVGCSGYEPWLFEGDRQRWLTVAGDRVRGAQEIAFEALTEVHAELFGARPLAP